MSKSKSEEYVREISCWLSMSGRDQSLLVHRINRHMSYARLSKKYGISPHRIRRIVLKFWERIATRLLAFDRQFGNREAELIGELIEIKLHNPSTVGDFIKANSTRPITAYGFSTRVKRCLFLSGIQTIDELANKHEFELLKIRNIGKKGIQEIETILAAYGYSLKQEPPKEWPSLSRRASHTARSSESM